MMIVNIGHNTSAVWLMLQIIKHTVYLVKFALFVDMFYSQLIAIRLANGAIFTGPSIPNVTIKCLNGIISVLLTVY